MSEYFANGSLHYQDGEWRDDNGDVVEIEQVKHGEWIIFDHTEYYVEAKCSICGAEGIFSHHQRKPKRCPSCGAYMDRYIHVFNMGSLERGK